jgi:hypothetical protein
MKYLAHSCLFISLLLFFPCQVPAQEGSLTVTEIAITTRIVRGKPVDSVRRISSSAVHELYCYTKVVAPDDGER